MPESQPAGVLPLEEVARQPPPGMAVAAALAFRPGGGALTYLLSPERSLTRVLSSHDLATGEITVVAGDEAAVSEEDLSLEEKLRRERARELGVGVTSYSWAAEAPVLIVPAAGAVHVSVGGEPLRLLVDAGDEPALDPQLSRDGSHLAFVRDAEVSVVPTDGSAEPRAVTSGARGTGRTNGLADYIAFEELGRSHGFWWSRDGRSVAFCEVDETHIPVYRIVHQGSDGVGAGAQEDHRYPFAGGSNPRGRLGVVPAAGGDVVWADVGGDDDAYLARVDWCHDGSLVVQVLDRRQQHLELRRVDPTSGSSTLLLAEESDVWVNVHDCFRSMPDGSFLWASERTGYRHLELRSADGALVRTLTAGEWMVTGVAGDDPDAGVVWFTATAESPLERHLYSVSLEGGEPLRLTSERGCHQVVVDHEQGLFADCHSALDRPPVVVLRSLGDGSVIRPVHDDPDPRVEQLGLRAPELTTVSTQDGETLHAVLHRPDADPPHPTIVSVYGGPHAQMVTDSWATGVSMRAQHLRSRGYLVVAVDNRGSAGRGLAFEAPIRGNLGDLEVRDQVDAISDLASRKLVDPDRVGIYGWSYGGYMTLMCMARAPEVFRVGVAGASVTHWDGYDTCYTERYMGLPEENPEGYEQSSVMAHVENITGKLLLVHGLIDENVHFRHTARLLNALIRARREAPLLLFPDERHVPRAEADRVYMEERVAAWFDTHL